MRDETVNTSCTSLLLWEACRREPRPGAVARAIDEGADMTLAATASVQHRIAALLWRALASAGRLDDLGDSRGSLGDLFEVYRMEALLLLPRAVALAVGPLANIGLEPVVLKGPAVAARYPDPGLRPMEDIDLLLPQAQHQRAVEELRRAGWAVARSVEPDVYDTVLTHPDVPTLALELHFALEHPSQRVTRLDAETLWARRQPIDCLGTPAYGLPLPEELVFLAAHAGKPHHGFFRLIWVADLAMIIGLERSQARDIDWGQVQMAAAEGSCGTMVGAAFALAERAGVESPPYLSALPTRGWRGSAMRQLTDVEWPLSHLALPGYHLNYALAETRTRRLRILFVLLGSGYGIGQSFRRVFTAPSRFFRRVRRRLAERSNE